MRTKLCTYFPCMYLEDIVCVIVAVTAIVLAWLLVHLILCVVVTYRWSMAVAFRGYRTRHSSVYILTLRISSSIVCHVWVIQFLVVLFMMDKRQWMHWVINVITYRTKLLSFLLIGYWLTYTMPPCLGHANKCSSLNRYWSVQLPPTIAFY